LAGAHRVSATGDLEASKRRSTSHQRVGGCAMGASPAATQSRSHILLYSRQRRSPLTAGRGCRDYIPYRSRP
jgi:hypothetical protein